MRLRTINLRYQTQDFNPEEIIINSLGARFRLDGKNSTLIHQFSWLVFQFKFRMAMNLKSTFSTCISINWIQLRNFITALVWVSTLDSICWDSLDQWSWSSPGSCSQTLHFLSIGHLAASSASSSQYSTVCSTEIYTTSVETIQVRTTRMTFMKDNSIKQTDSKNLAAKIAMVQTITKFITEIVVPSEIKTTIVPNK